MAAVSKGVDVVKEDYYSINKIVHIIKYYHINIKNIKELQQDAKSVGIAQYGIEATLPKGNDISSVVENEVLRIIEKSSYFANVLTDIKYIQDRWHRVTDEQEAMVLTWILDGESVRFISSKLGKNRTHIYRVLREIARKIKGYPQLKETKATNFVIGK